MSRFVIRVLVAGLPLLAVLASACDSTTQPTATSTLTTTPTTTATTPVYATVTETFNGTLVSGATNLHTFHVMPGQVTATLVSLDPSTSPPLVGMGIGMWDGISCVMVLDTTEAAPGTVLVGTASVDSNVCLKVWDPATLAADATLKYQVTAVHKEKPSS